MNEETKKEDATVSSATVVDKTFAPLLMADPVLLEGATKGVDDNEGVDRVAVKDKLAGEPSIVMAMVPKGW